MGKPEKPSTRSLLRAFQTLSLRGLSPAFVADFELLKHKDLDLSIRLGALLGFNALLLGSAIQPISASPGAPLSLDAASQPFEVLAISIGVVLLSISGYICARAILIGEEFSAEGAADDPQIIAQRLFAAYCFSVDAQSRSLARAVRLTLWGGGITLAACLWIMAAKFFGF